jgi:hypothetical protein
MAFDLRDFAARYTAAWCGASDRSDRWPSPWAITTGPLIGASLSMGSNARETKLPRDLLTAQDRHVLAIR